MPGCQVTLRFVGSGDAFGSGGRSQTCLALEEGPAHPIGPANIRVYGVDHPSGAPAYAVRAEYAGAVVAYSGDTAWTDPLLEVARGANVDHSAELDCCSVVLTHLHADMLARRASSRFRCAADGDLVSLPAGR